MRIFQVLVDFAKISSTKMIRKLSICEFNSHEDSEFLNRKNQVSGKPLLVNLIRKNTARGKMSFRSNSINFILAKHLKLSPQKLVLAKINSRKAFLGVKFRQGKVLAKTKK